jgi:hypothetical protein
MCIFGSPSPPPAPVIQQAPEPQQVKFGSSSALEDRNKQLKTKQKSSSPFSIDLQTPEQTSGLNVRVG